MKQLALCLAFLIAPAASAEESPADIAREASDFLNQAALALSEAEGSRNRIAALTTGEERPDHRVRRALLEIRIERVAFGEIDRLDDLAAHVEGKPRDAEPLVGIGQRVLGALGLGEPVLLDRTGAPAND